jgi:uncharacterized RDD family membrane protein YckC
VSPRRPPAEEQASLFDLELAAAPEETSLAPGERLPPLAPADEPPGERDGEEATAGGEAVAAPLGSRVSAGLVDLLVHLAVLLVALGGLRLLGVAAGLDDLAPLALVLLVFSLFYTVIPLAFWGRTAGMAALGLVCRGERGHPVTFGQAAWRWAAGVITVGTAGLALLLALSGRTLGERLSGSLTLQLPRR